MSVSRRSASQTFTTAALRWSLYVLVGLSLVGLMLRITARTVALAQSASPEPSATLTPRPTAVIVVAVVPSATPSPVPSGTPVTPTPTASPTITPIPGATLTAIYKADCALYPQVPPDLLTVVNKDQALARDFQPAD